MTNAASPNLTTLYCTVLYCTVLYLTTLVSCATSLLSLEIRSRLTRVSRGRGPGLRTRRENIQILNNSMEKIVVQKLGGGRDN